MEESLRPLALSLFALVLAAPALAGTPYTPLPLQKPDLVTPPPELIADATAFLKALQSGDGDAIAKGIAPKVLAVDGALELAIPRRGETVGPHAAIEDMLSELANYIGGDVEEPAPGGDPRRNRIKAEREYIVQALTDGRPWGTDPRMKGAICTYAYRSFDVAAVKKLSDKLKVQSSSFFYVDAPYELHQAPDAKSPRAGRLETDRLYALDYKTDAPGRWIAVYRPDGSSGFVSFDEVELQKPYAAGVCFTKAKDGHWVMSGQASTSL